MREDAIVRNFQTRKGTRAGNWSDLRDIFACVNSHHARRVQGSARIDAGDSRVCVNRSNKSDVQGVRQSNVIDVMRQTLDQSRVFGSFDSLTDVSYDLRVGQAFLPVLGQTFQSVPFGNGQAGMPVLLLGSGVFDRFDNVLVASAATKIAFEAMAYFVARGIGVSIDELRGRHDHAGRAITALQSMLFPKALLHRVQFAVFCEAFDGGDFAAIRLYSEQRARLHSLAVDENCASAAKGSLAANVRPGETEQVPQVMDEQQARLDFVLVAHAVNTHADSLLHSYLTYCLVLGALYFEICS